MNIYEKLLHIQQNLKAPKSQYNKFGNFYYRSCEDIQEAVKPPEFATSYSNSQLNISTFFKVFLDFFMYF